MSKIEICSVPTYKKNYEKTTKHYISVPDIETYLSIDNQYHERLDVNDKLKLSIDLDHITRTNKNASFNMICNDICKYLNISMTDISYTTNFSSLEGSHHIVIPKYFMNSTEQKQLWTDFKEKYNYGNEIDANIFGKNGWFRLPNQTKEGVKNTEHIIQKGNIEDFVLKYIPENCTEYKKNIISTNTLIKTTSSPKQSCPNPSSKPSTDPNHKYELYDKAKIIDKKYIDSYCDWFKIICCLKNDNIDNYDIAFYITSKSEKFKDEQWLKDIWNGIDVGKYKYTLGTFNYYSKSSNEKDYLQIISKYHHADIESVIKRTTEENIAKCFYSLFGEDFLYTNETVYYWNGIVWEQSKTALRRVFTSSFTQIFINCQIQNLKKMRDSNDEPETPEYKDLVNKNKVYTDIINFIQKNNVIKNICNDAIKVYIENNNVSFEKNPYAFCFNNKVYDLKTCQFVEPTKDDYMTLTTGYDYEEPTNEEKEDIENALDKMFPNKEEKKLFLILLSLTLFGKTIEKFIIMTGGGRNGKGVINELNRKMLGNYGYTCANAVLLSPIKDGANQTIRNMNNKRGIVYREPDSGTYSKINSCTVKELTGGSEINARGLHSSDTTTHLRATHFLECNTKPDMSGDIDDAIIMRLIIIEFVSTFTKNKEDVDENNHVYLGDDDLKEPVWQEQHRCALFQILTEYWKIIKDDMNIDKFIPSIVKDRVKTYMSKSNKLMNWFNNHYEQVDDDKKVIVLRDVYQAYKDSEDYMNLNKEEKRKTTEKSMIEFFEKNPFTRKCYHLRDKRKSTQEYYNKSEVRNVLWSFRIRKEEDNDDEVIDNEKEVIKTLKFN
jgi:hypothetical protein